MSSPSTQADERDVSHIIRVRPYKNCICPVPKQETVIINDFWRKQMARLNVVMLKGAVAREPHVSISPDGKKGYAIVYVNVMRGYRDVGDGALFVRTDNPLIMTRDMKCVEEIATWHTYDIVDIKGMLATRTIAKQSYCTYCHTINSAQGMLVYVYPTYAKKVCHLESAKECKQYISECREVSNQIYITGTLIKKPQQIKTKSGLVITQYPIKTYRKIMIRSDDPEIRADYPWVKGYGAIAENDFKRLDVGSEVLEDGFLQVRSVLRHTICGAVYNQDGKVEADENGIPRMRKKPNGKTEGCGRMYDWEDRATEIVPYAVEYTGEYKGDEEDTEEGQEERAK